MCSPTFIFSVGPLVTHTISSDEEYGVERLRSAMRGVEVLASPRKSVSSKELFFKSFALEASPLVYANFIEKQMTLSLGCIRWVNLAPEALNREEVRSVLSALLIAHEPSRFLRRMTPLKRYESVGFEIVESERLSKEAQVFMAELAAAGYSVAIDDVGTGVHADQTYLRELLGVIGPAKLKIDASHVDMNGLSGSAQYLLEMLPRKFVTELTLEGVPVNPTASQLLGHTATETLSRAATEVFLFRGSRSHEWSTLMSRLEHRYAVPITAQLAPLLLDEMQAVFEVPQIE